MINSENEILFKINLFILRFGMPLIILFLENKEYLNEKQALAISLVRKMEAHRKRKKKLNPIT